MLGMSYSDFCPEHQSGARAVRDATHERDYWKRLLSALAWVKVGELNEVKEIVGSDTLLGRTGKPQLGREWTRLDGVDLLRTFAIVFVLLNHVNMRLLSARVPYLVHVPQPLATALVWNAQRGVQIFFAVSGFLITSTALRRWGSISRVSLRDFYLLRFARIAPLLLLLLVLLSVLHLGHVNHYIVTQKTGGLPRAIFAALTFHVNVLEARRGYLPANWDILWSLSVEEVFYLFFPVVCYLVPNIRTFVILLMTLIVLGPSGRTVFAHGNEVWREYSYVGSMDAIALGCLTALLLSRRRPTRRAMRFLALAGVGILIFVLGFSDTYFYQALQMTGLDMSILAVGTCLVIVAVAQTRWSAGSVLRPLLNLGRRSYEIYLTHMFVVFAAFDVFLKARKPMFGVPIFFVVVILAAGALGELVARFYSEPINRTLRRKFTPSLRSVTDSETAEAKALSTY
jgi:peptidoglycan/LPS O-acetylase OafA/YrhL